MIHTTHPIPLNLQQYYFEIRIQDQRKSEGFKVGFTKMIYQRIDNHLIPAREKVSISYHANGLIVQEDEWSHQAFKRVECEKIVQGDVIGCFASKVWLDKVSFWKIHFTKNGSTLNHNSYLEDGYYCPTIEMRSAGAKVSTNLGDSDFEYKAKGINKVILFFKIYV